MTRKKQAEAHKLVDVAEAYKLLHVAADGSLRSLCDDSPWEIGKMRWTDIVDGYAGEDYVHTSPEAAMRESVPPDALHSPHNHVALARCEVWGWGWSYPCGEEEGTRYWTRRLSQCCVAKLATSCVQPIEILAQW